MLQMRRGCFIPGIKETVLQIWTFATSLHLYTIREAENIYRCAPGRVFPLPSCSSNSTAAAQHQNIRQSCCISHRIGIGLRQGVTAVLQLLLSRRCVGSAVSNCCRYVVLIGSQLRLSTVVCIHLQYFTALCLWQIYLQKEEPVRLKTSVPSFPHVSVRSQVSPLWQSPYGKSATLPYHCKLAQVISHRQLYSAYFGLRYGVLHLGAE